MDIDSFAVNIAMLRMWLSLAIDYEGDTPEPLPNLDFKVVCGDSLLGPDPSSGAEVQGGLGYSQDKVQLLGRLKGEFLRESNGDKKGSLRSEITGLNAEIRESLGAAADEVLNWRVEFAEVFGGGRGFDIAIANPPYVQLEKDNGRLRSLYKDSGYEILPPRGDIYQLFYERGCQMLQPEKGILAYITSNSWLKAEYGKPLRRYFYEKHTPLLLLDLGKDVFESAIVDSGVLMLRTGGGAQPFPAVDMDRVKSAEIPPSAELWGQARPDGDAPWSVLSHTEHSVLDKMRAKGTPLKDWDVSIWRGVITGYNKAFIIDKTTREQLIAADPKSAEIIKPVLRGRDIQRYQAQWAGLWLIVVKFGSYMTLPEGFPTIYQHLLQHEVKLKARGQCRYTRSGSKNTDYPGQHHWLELDNNPKDSYLEEFGKEKLLWMDMSDRGRFAYSDTEMYCNNKGFLMTGESLKYLCAVLNSNLVTWLLKNTARTTGMGLTQWEKFAVERIPVAKLSTAKQRPFVRLVDRILEAKAADPHADTSELEREIDRLVYDLYGLTEEEDTAVERALGLIHQTDEEEDAALLRAMEEAGIDNPEDFVSEADVIATLRSLRDSHGN